MQALVGDIHNTQSHYLSLSLSLSYTVCLCVCMWACQFVGQVTFVGQFVGQVTCKYWNDMLASQPKELMGLASGSSAGLQLLAIPEQCICTYMITFTHTHTYNQLCTPRHQIKQKQLKQQHPWTTVNYVHRVHPQDTLNMLPGMLLKTLHALSFHGLHLEESTQTDTHTHTWLQLMTDTQPNTHLYDYHNLCICALDFKMQGARLLAQPLQLFFLALQTT